MVDVSSMKRSMCFVKMVRENYYFGIEDIIIPKIHLIFNSEEDYDKLSDIEKMFKKYFKIEKSMLIQKKVLNLLLLERNNQAIGRI